VHIEKKKLFSVLSNDVRLRCVYLLSRFDEICVCELVDALEVAQPTASKALASLRSAGLVTDRREANWIYYRLQPDLPGWVKHVISAVVEAAELDPDYLADVVKFKELVERPRSVACP
tara:strand:+ start:22402 stop:22755 length:354 start_codon:yes stop_codon:yes gene_type:complete